MRVYECNSYIYIIREYSSTLYVGISGRPIIKEKEKRCLLVAAGSSFLDYYNYKLIHFLCVVCVCVGGGGGGAGPGFLKTRGEFCTIF